MIFEIIKKYDLDVVNYHSSETDISKFVASVADMKGIEGFVIAFEDGHRVKIKTSEYVAIHKAKEKILQDRNIVEMIVNNTFDDVLAHLPDEDREKLINFQFRIVSKIHLITHTIYQESVIYTKMSRKEFALGPATNLDSYTKAVVFKVWEGLTKASVYEAVLNTVKNNVNRNTSWNELQEAWFENIKFN
jgi:RNA ligase